MIAFVFPGQGAQSVGMGLALYEQFQPYRDTFAQADDALNGTASITRLCLSGPAGELIRTENAQPCMLTLGVATCRALMCDGEIDPDVVAGHSLGEYTALVVANALDFDDAVKLVRKRGEFMREIIDPQNSAMAAVSGIDKDTLRGMCEEASAAIRDEGGDQDVVVPANFNSPRQIVISGHRAAVEHVIARVEVDGHSARELRVSQPFHCPIMQPAADRLAEEIGKVRFNDAQIPVVTNVDAEPTTSGERLKELLVEQVTAPVRWRESIDEMVQMGVDEFCELGPAPILTNLMKHFDHGVKTTLVDSPESILGHHWKCEGDRRTHIGTGRVVWNDGMEWDPRDPAGWGF
ncbi:MAG: ACP S-malonyltransferase [bacterium]|nr:ACP S-malonyltransferase [bacterium]